ncbi:hypothetical protein BASA81_016976 [Batrachochytrium salamandrivorans]|nr:hypothetical protein BASA81_016976 [Batrachochytrium salamandrivorans]
MCRRILSGLSRPTTPRKVNLMDRLDSQRTKQREQAEQAKQAEKLLEEKQRQKPFRERTAQDFINQESNLRSRDKLTKEAFSGGYWKDFHEVSRKGAKLWEAPEKIRSGQHSQPIPNVTGRLMSGEKTDVMSYVSKHKVTMVVFFFKTPLESNKPNRLSSPFMDEFKTHPNIDLLILNVEEKFLRAPILWLARPYVRWNIPEELRSRYMIHYGSIKESRMACGMMNNVLGWVNLVDSSGRIRWQAHGNATQRELQSVSLLTKTLLRLS